jgi:hypothetical protein
MPVKWDNVIKGSRMVITRGSLAGGTLELMSAGGVVLAIFTITSGGGSVAGPVWTVAFVSNTVNGLPAAGAGTAATQARFKDAGGTVRGTEMTVGTSGADINLLNPNIVSGEGVTINGTPTITHGA